MPLPVLPMECLHSNRSRTSRHSLGPSFQLATVAPNWTQSGLVPRCVPMGRGVLTGLGFSFLLVGLLLLCADCSPQPAWGYAAYEIVTPKKVDSKADRASQGSMSYFINIQGVNYTIHLKQKKDFVVKNFPILTRDSEGQVMIEQPHVLADCYYQGYVEGILDSMVTLSTCSGLRGLLQIGNLTYSIEPLSASSTFEHLLLQREAAVPGTVIYKTLQGGRQFPGYRAAPKQFQPWGPMRYLELMVVVDKEGFDAFGTSITNVMLEVIEIIHLVDGLFSSVRLRVVLTVLEIWTEKNPISITKNVTQVLHSFNHWRIQHSPAHIKHDVGCLFASLNFSSSTRPLHMGSELNFASACNRQRSSAVVSFAKQSYIDTAVHVARELGYVLGMKHDDKHCRCGSASKCIMNPRSTVSYAFSNCSTKYYYDFITTGQGKCLNNIPSSTVTFLPQRCGNGVLEDKEECDCGSEEQCKSDPCCDNTCQKKKGAICASGGCCKDCKLLPEGEVCRKSSNPCDLPEYCNGTSEHCPEDVAKQDGTMCAADGYCYSGKCRSRTLQCKDIFGERAQPAPLQCFEELNVKGDRFGNCWGDGTDTEFQKCELENVLCGRLQCTNVRDLPRTDHSTLIQTPVGDTWCWGTEYHVGLDSSDTGVIEDGTQCGKKKICINRTCVPEEKYLASHCSANTTCRGKGICNTKGNCHCDNGWAPPFCQYAGFGGSIDSGPTPVRRKGLFNYIMRITLLTGTLLILAALAIEYIRKLIAARLSCRPCRWSRSRKKGPEKEEIEFQSAESQDPNVGVDLQQLGSVTNS
ncbi:disintegrin and metalloproteinase domain-containing protein 21-like [Excalfactoria chinensis]|uniref:disintegrin and metalloproteinase domain-containing protein 21-like n=1 Tax=Excalfactoria chinensis TaxID=46218 RepID=UPI003B3BA8D2